MIKESEKYDFIDILHNAKNSLELCKKNIITERKEKLIELYNLAREKIKNQQYSQETIDILNKVLKESEQYDFLDLHENVKKSLIDCKDKKNQEKLKETK